VVGWVGVWLAAGCAQLGCVAIAPPVLQAPQPASETVWDDAASLDGRSATKEDIAWLLARATHRFRQRAARREETSGAKLVLDAAAGVAGVPPTIEAFRPEEDGDSTGRRHSRG